MILIFDILFCVLSHCIGSATTRVPASPSNRFASGRGAPLRKSLDGSPSRASSSTATASALVATKKDFRVGQMIRIKKHMKPGYHEGEVIRKNTDGTYDIEYGE